MAVHLTRRRGPLPADIEFASLDSTSSGWSREEAESRPRTGPASDRAADGDFEIVPLVRLGVIHGLDGPRVEYGPFNPPNKTSVPRWLAVHLKKKRKCRIVPPKWFKLEYFEEMLKEEQSSSEFSDLPRDYLEVSKVLLDVASDDVTEPDRIRLVLKDIREARQAKIREGLAAVNSVHLGMPNLSTLELAELKPFFTQSFVRLAQLDPEAERYKAIEDKWIEDPESVWDEVRSGALGARRGRGMTGEPGMDDDGSVFGHGGGF
ncbi:hypothetical protein JCM10212_004189 [Sporobolomyces blumeae]